MKTIIKMCMFLLPFTLYGAEVVVPKDCQLVPISGKEALVKVDKKTLVLIQNVTPHDLWVTHPVAETSASAGWSSKLEAEHWSALSLAKGPFALQCIESRPGHEQQIPCAGAISVCTLKKVKFPADAQGSFWAAENLSLPALMTAVGSRGYLIKP
ncbi:MAG: hypothetical protein BGO90_11380 [Legionella sp. 40-6]|nr:hypothetical protein [Legionella sp.]OJY54451.1 MAG: hypothetical protein BGO90_11380 [Legionella sp. 40-6]